MTAEVQARGAERAATAPGQPNGGHRAEMLAALAEQLRCAIHDEQERRYTLHVDFAADDPAKARELAVALATGLGVLRPDVETYSARLSAGDRWTDAQPAFCMADGPDGAFCGYPARHEGWHAEAGVDGLSAPPATASPARSLALASLGSRLSPCSRTHDGCHDGGPAARGRNCSVPAESVRAGWPEL